MTLSATIPTRTHHTFLGWATDSSATSADYSSGGSYTANASATLYAVWAYTPPATYTVSYYANGGTGAPSAQTKTEGETMTLSTVRPTRTGYTFYGWATDSTASAVVYAAGDSYTADASVTLYAVWQVNQYSVAYNANGGYGAPSAQTKTYGVALTLSSTIPTRSGYNFLGWGIAGNDTEPSYAAGGTYTANSGINLYAVWQRIPETYTATVSLIGQSQTPDTRFESEAPSSYQNVSTPSDSTDQATWTMWEYEDGSFVLKKYGIQISSDSPVVAPSLDCVSAVYENDKWTMRSGYGITMSYAPSISTVSGYDHPDSNAYTSVQYAVATFPEFRYFDTDGNCRTLQYVNGSYQFVENPDADGSARVHFIPVYVRDGNYTVSVTATHVWTPAGMIEATRSANVIIIDGTIYDDWYQG